MRSTFSLWATTALFVLAGTARGQITLVDLGLPGAGADSLGQSINNNGLAIVRTNQGTLSWLRAPDGTYTEAGVPAGYDRSSISKINDFGVSVGSVAVGTSLTRPAIRGATGIYTLPLGSNQGNASAVNAGGDVVGIDESTIPSRGFLYRPGVGVSYIPLPTGASAWSVAEPASINTSGLVVGHVGVPSGTPGVSMSRGYRFTLGGGSVLMPTTGNEPADPTDVNDAGVVVGSIGGFGATSVRAVKWLPDNTIVDLESPSPTGFISAKAINSLGDIVGSGFIAGPRAVLWADDYGSVDLNDLLSAEDRLHWVLMLSYDINDQRQVVGLGRFDPDGPPGPAPAVNHGFLLNLPIPEPVAGVWSFVLLFAAKRRRP